jgi:hypothetical protein
MSYVLMSRTRGDDLEPSRTEVVAGSERLDDLYDLKDERERERERDLQQWLAALRVPDYSLPGSVIAREWIELVPTVDSLRS